MKVIALILLFLDCWASLAEVDRMLLSTSPLPPLNNVPSHA